MIGLLSKDPRGSIKVMARQLQLSEATVASRIRSLQDRRVIKVVARQRALGTNGYTVLSLVDIHVDDPRKIAEVSGALSAVGDVIAAYETARRPEIVAYLRARDLRHLGEIPEEIQRSVACLAQMSLLPIMAMQRRYKYIGSLELPTPPAPLSRDLGARIVAALERDGRQPVRALARELGVSDTAVRYRLGKLIKLAGFEIVTVCDAQAMGYAVRTDVRLRVSPPHLKATLIKLSANDSIISVSHIAGPYNVHAVVLSKTVDEFDDFINGTIRLLKGLDDFAILRITRLHRYNYNIIM